MEQMELFDTTQLLNTSRAWKMFAKDKKIRIPLQFAEDYIYRKHVSI